MAREVRKTVTVFFADVVGSTALGERLDPEALRAVMSRWFDLAERTLERHGATVEKFIGDAVMAVFGVPVVHEDDALRAVRAADELRSELEELNTELARAPGVRLEVRMGITTGEAVAGSAGERQKLVTGDVVNTAKRLEEAAAPGEILVGLVTATLVAGAAVLEHAGPVEAKGKAETVDTWRVHGVDPEAAGVRRRLGGIFVGRDEPLRRLTEALQLAEGERRCVPALVTGPPGIGKSRLARELFGACEGRARVLRGRCIPYGRGVTFWALGEIVQSAGGIASLPLRGGDAPVVRERLEVAIGESSASVPGDEIFWAVRRAVESLATEGPLVICIDDLHLAEPMLLDLVEYLAGWCRDAPVLLLGLARPELLEGRAAPSGTLVVELEPLGAADCGAILDDLGIHEPHLRTRIVATADGNPLFVEQLAAMLHELDAGELTVPASITAVLDARLDSLPAAERAVLERASVVGKEFWLDAVAHLAPPEHRSGTASALLALARKGLVEPMPSSSLPFEDVSRFRHALIRDAAYAGLPKGERAELHERFAERLGGNGSSGGHAPDAIAGFHLEHAWRYRRELGLDDEHTRQLGESAGRRLGAAARRALTREDVPGACSLLERAVPLLPHGDFERLELEVEWSNSLRELLQTDRGEEVALALLDEAIAASDPVAAAHARLALQNTRLLADDVTDHRQVVLEAIDVFEQAEDSRALARAWRRLAWLEHRDGAHAASEHAAREAIRHAIACSDLREEARAVDGLCTSLLYGPTPVPEALAECRSLLDRAHESPTLEANVLSAVAGLEAMQGSFVDAHSAYERAARVFEDLGLRLALAGLTTVGVPLELLAGDAEAAEREARRGIEILAEVGGTAFQAPLLAEALLAAGRTDEAEAALTSIDPEHTPTLVPWQVKWRCTQALVAARTGSDGTSLAREAVALAGDADDPNLTGEALVALAETLAALGEDDEAAEATGRARIAFERKGNRVAAEALGPTAVR